MNLLEKVSINRIKTLKNHILDILPEIEDSIFPKYYMLSKIANIIHNLLFHSYEEALAEKNAYTTYCYK